MSKRAATREKLGQKYNPEGRFIRYDYVCPHNGSLVRQMEKTSSRVTFTTKIRCPWHAKIVFRTGLSVWQVDFLSSLHNYPASSSRIGDTNDRRQWRERNPQFLETWVERLAITGGMSSNRIAAFLSGNLDANLDDDDVHETDTDEPEANETEVNELEDTETAAGETTTADLQDDVPESNESNCNWGDQPIQRPNPFQLLPPISDQTRIPVTAQDVRVIFLRRLRTTTYGPLSATQHFLEVLEQNKQRHGLSDKVRRDSNGDITGIFWTFRPCINMWKKHHNLLLIDNTYKVSSNICI